MSPEAAAGVDAGATLAKVVVRRADGNTERRLHPAGDAAQIVQALVASTPRRVGVTGGGAAALLARLDAEGVDAVQVNEFAAWGSGAASLLAEQTPAPHEPYLLVSLGTGTSVMLSEGMAVSRIGGTALGGGTIVGLGALLLRSRDFDEISRLASRGDRRNVDLLVSDIYRPGEIALTGDLTAANFGKLGRATPGRDNPTSSSPEDLAQAIMGLVGENVALICTGLASGRQLRRIVFGGTTLRNNPVLRTVLGLITGAFGHEVIFLEGGEYAGAVGALELATTTGA